MKAYEGVNISTYSWSRQYSEMSGQFHVPASLPTGERDPGACWLGGPETGLNDVSGRKNLVPIGTLTP
jgi:hypothetical protein